MIPRTLLLLLLALLMNSVASGQEMRVVNGRKYQVHRVLASETLYALSRHYALPVQAIIDANPSAAIGLSIGQVILIPQDAVVKKEKRNAPALFAGELAHTVARKETLYGISRQYAVDASDLLQRNPELIDGMKEGMIVIIPITKVSGISDAQRKPAEDDGSTSHQVLAGETLFSLGQRYGVKPENIQRANGGLPEGLKAGQYVRIPTVKAPQESKEIAADSVSRKERYDVAFLLPFSINRNDSLHGADPANKELFNLTSIAAHFYAGAQMAIDSLERLGLNADVHVYDVGGDAKTWAPVIKRNELRTMDLFIGPFHRSAIEELARVNSQAHVACPVAQSNKVLLGHPMVSKALSARSDQVIHLARFIAARHARDNIILCRPEIPGERELQAQMARALENALASKPLRLRDSLLVAVPGKGNIADLQAKLHAAHLNIVVVPSEDVEFVSGLVGKLALLTDKYRISVVGLNTWMEMTSLDPFDLDRLDTHVPAASFIDRTDPRVIRFIRNFRDRFHFEPDEYAFLGFDVSCYYLSAIMTEGNSFASHFAKVRTSPLHMAFSMQRAGMENGYRNESTYILKYEELELRRVE